MKRRLLTIVLAAVLAVFGIVAVLTYVRQADNRAVNGLKAETVMVARAAIPAGTSLHTAQQQDLLTTERVPVSSVLGQPVSEVTPAIANLVTSSNLASGELLFRNMLVPASSVVSSNSFVIPKGMVAVTVAMCINEAVAGYVTAGSDVMVYATVPSNPKVLMQRGCTQNHNAVPPIAANTNIVLSNVKVLAVGQAPVQTAPASHTSVLTDPANALSTSSASSDAVLVTCAVTPAQAGLLIQAVQLYLPYLALLQTSH